MIKEIKKKVTRFGTIVTYFDHQFDSESSKEALNKMGAISAFVDIHHIGTSFEKTYGVNWIGHKAVPSAQNIIGHVISGIRGDGLVVFIKADTLLAPAVEKVYAYAESLKMQRAYGFFVGSREDPIAVAISAPLLEHLFHTIPHSIKADEKWIRWTHGWIMQTLTGGRYFDATDILGVKPEADTAPAPEPLKGDSKAPSEHPAPPAGWDRSSQSTEVVISTNPAQVEVNPERRKPGRPKKK